MNSELTHAPGSSGIGTSRSGADVLIVGNLATASLVNPEREADQWAATQIKRVQASRKNEMVVVIGVGSGFHLRALQDQLRQAGIQRPMTAIDTCAESVNFASARAKNVDFICADPSEGVDRFLTKKEVEGWVVQTYTLLKHRPTLARVGVPLRTIEDWLLGRSPESFSAHLKLRPQIAAALNPGRARRIAETPLVSIRDLSKKWDISSELKTDRRIFRVLEELVR